MTVFEKMGHLAKTQKCLFLMLFDSIIPPHNYDIFGIFLSYSVKSKRVIVFQYLVNINLEKERLVKFTLFPYTTSSYISLLDLLGKITCSL